MHTSTFTSKIYEEVRAKAAVQPAVFKEATNYVKTIRVELKKAKADFQGSKTKDR